MPWEDGSTVVSIWAREPRVPIRAGHFSFFGVTAEWPNITQIAAILSLDGTYNVIYI